LQELFTNAFRSYVKTEHYIVGLFGYDTLQYGRWFPKFPWNLFLQLQCKSLSIKFLRNFEITSQETTLSNVK